MKAIDLFNIIYYLDELTEDEFISIIWSNKIDEDFVGTMSALLEFYKDKGGV